MTEQEALEYLKDANRNNQMVGILPKSDIGKCLVNALEEIQQYRAIGTPEECREAVEKQKKAEHRCKDCAGCTQWKCDCSNIRNKAIDDFVEKLKANYEDDEDIYAILSDNDTYAYATSCVLFEEYIDRIAEQLKGGGVNE